MEKKELKIIPLGGLGEVGRNMMLLEYDNQILIIDIGLTFPELGTPGIDYIIPNISYITENPKKRVVGIILTHGHMDHIGAIPYLINKIEGNFPIYAGALTKEMVLHRQKEFAQNKKIKIDRIKDHDTRYVGPFQIEFVRMNHSIFDTFGSVITTPCGKIFHTTDFKFDERPIFDKPTNYARFEEIGQKGIDLLLSDSTGAESPGSSLSEIEIMENLEEIFKKSTGKIIASTFSSLLNRIQEIIELSKKYNRKIAIEGRSMKGNIEIAEKLGYITIQKGQKIETKHIDQYKLNQITIICTGAQGEERATLSRISKGDSKFIKLRKGDSVILSSSIVPGNEVAVQELKDSLLRNGAVVYHYKMMDIHASGHAKQDELVRMIDMIKPRYLLPVHGQYSMLKKMVFLAQETGMKENNVSVIENGDILSLSPEKKISIEKNVVPVDSVFVDGLGVGDVGKVVLRDRERLSDDGIFVVIIVLDRRTGKLQNSPDIISRGFIYLKESQNILRETRKKVIRVAETASQNGVDEDTVKKEIREKIASYLFAKTKRRPMVLPVVIKV